MSKRGLAAVVFSGAVLSAGCDEKPADPAFPMAASALKTTPGMFAPVELVRVEPDCRQLAGAGQPIVVELIVTETGAVRSGRVRTKIPQEAEAVILTMARQWLFRPATLHGKPVEVTIDVTLRRCP